MSEKTSSENNNNNNIVKSSEIKLRVDLDVEKIPAKISWIATDSPMQKDEDCAAFILSIWDGNKKEDKNIHLWTKDMTVEEMNHFYFRNMMLMSDTLIRSTGNKDEAQRLKDFAMEFGKRNGVLK